jgi:hypothetical protein
VEPDSPLGGDAVHGPVVEPALAGQRRRRVGVARPRGTEHAVAVRVEHDDVQVDDDSAWVHQEEVPCRRAVLPDGREPEAGQDVYEGIEMPGLDRDVEVGMFAALQAEQGVDTPTAVDPQAGSGRAGQIENREHITEHITERGAGSGRGAGSHAQEYPPRPLPGPGNPRHVSGLRGDACQDAPANGSLR